MKSKDSGFTYIEILIAVVLISICLIPMIDALQPAIGGQKIYERQIIDMYALQSKMEEVLNKPYYVLNNAARPNLDPPAPPTLATTLSDASYTTTDGRTIIRNVFISPYDGDNADGDDDPFSGTDAGLLYIKVEIPNSSLYVETLTNQ